MMASKVKGNFMCIGIRSDKKGASIGHLDLIQRKCDSFPPEGDVRSPYKAMVVGLKVIYCSLRRLHVFVFFKCVCALHILKDSCIR